MQQCALHPTSSPGVLGGVHQMHAGGHSLSQPLSEGADQHCCAAAVKSSGQGLAGRYAWLG